VPPSTRPKPDAEGVAADAPSDHISHRDFHLVESSAGWRLTITMTDELRRALAAAESRTSATFSVRVEPNLLPGEAFNVSLDVREPTPRSG
jgi:hypothetical protein